MIGSYYISEPSLKLKICPPQPFQVLKSQAMCGASVRLFFFLLPKPLGSRQPSSAGRQLSTVGRDTVSGVSRTGLKPECWLQPQQLCPGMFAVCDSGGRGMDDMRDVYLKGPRHSLPSLGHLCSLLELDRKLMEWRKQRENEEPRRSPWNWCER